VKPLGIALPMLHFQAVFLFPNVSTLSGATGSSRNTSRNISCMVTIPCMSEAVRNFVAEFFACWREHIMQRFDGVL